MSQIAERYVYLIVRQSKGKELNASKGINQLGEVVYERQHKATDEGGQEMAFTSPFSSVFHRFARVCVCARERVPFTWMCVARQTRLSWVERASPLQLIPFLNGTCITHRSWLIVLSRRRASFSRKLSNNGITRASTIILVLRRGQL